MGSKTSYDRDVKAGVKRKMVRMTQPEAAAVKAALTRHGSYAPTFSALVRRGLVLACKELDEKDVVK